MTDAAFATAKYPAYTTTQLEEFLHMPATDVPARIAMRAEINRRDRVAAGDKSVMTPGERLRFAKPETRDIGVIGPVDGMNNLSAEGPYFRVVLMKGDNQQRSEYLISKGAAENLRDELRALLMPPPVFDDGPTAA